MVERNTPPRKWLLLVYKVPRKPTALRVSIWRKLKQLDALLLHDSVWVLPATPQTREHYQWLASEIVEMGGEATVWVSEMAAEHQGMELAKALLEKTDTAYKEILSKLKRKNTDLASLARQYQRILARDYFHSSLGEKVRKALLTKGENAT
jgi:hypothetical protein